MKKKRNIIITCIMLVLLGICVNISFATEKYNAKTYIDNPSNIEEKIVQDEFEIEGWYMTNDEEAKLKIYVDDVEQEIIELERKERGDVQNAIIGYGSVEQNPMPGYIAKINLSNIIDGQHTLKVAIISRDNEVLTTDQRSIKVQKYTAKSYIDLPTIGEAVKPNFTVSGWVMTNDEESEVRIYIDGKIQTIENLIRKERTDVLNSIKGYGGAEKNPLPGFDAIIAATNISDGMHTLNLEVVSREGKVISSSVQSINYQNYKAKTYIDTPTEKYLTDGQLEIEGWVMTDDEKSQIKVYIDGIEQETLSSERRERGDVQEAIKGYGSIEQNPTPGYILKLDMSKLKDGIHNVEIRITSRTGDILSEVTRKIELKKYNAKIHLDLPTTTEIAKPNFIISGWVMTDDEESQLNIYIDEKKQNIENLVRSEREDVLNAIKGYGGAEKNPTPGFATIIDTSNLKEGTHIIKIEVTSREGNVISSISQMIKYEDYKAKTYIDSPEGKETDGILTVEGWIMTDDSDAEIKVYVDGKEQEILSLERTEREDVRNSIKNFGDKEQNPLPGYILTVDASEFKDGQYSLRIDVISREGKVMAKSSRNINVNKYKARVYMDVPLSMGQSRENLFISGWLMATDEEATFKVFINDVEQNITSFERTERTDVLSSIKGYGGAEKNPLPGFEAQLDVSKFEDGKYTLKIEILSREGEVMCFETRVIVIYNNYDLGIDVSSHNGTINWAQVKQTGIKYAIIRAGFRGYGTGGSLNVDTKFVENMKGAISNGIEVGVYFYSQAITVEEAIEEADMTIRLIKENGFGDDITFPVVIDTEKSGGRADSMSKDQRTIVVRAFCDRISSYGYKTMIYSNKYWLRDNLNMDQLNEHDVWMAHYTGTDDPINNPSDYEGKYQIWQYTSSGSVYGINGNVDLNISYKKYFK